MEQHSAGSDDPLTAAERQFLIESGVPPDSFDIVRHEAARASLRRRAEETRRNAAAALTIDQVAGLLSCTESQVLRWARDKDVYSYATAEGPRFPEWQFPANQRLLGLRPVLQGLGPEMHPYSVEGLLAVVPHEELDDMTVVAWLRRGGAVEPAVALVLDASYDL